VKALVLLVLCVGLTLGVCLVVRRVLDSITAQPQALRPARRSSPAARPVADILQQLTRVRTAEGRVAVRGTLVAEFAAGARDAMLYVAFCPPFERLPEVDAHVTDDTTASVKVAQRLHHGAQLDVRLPAAAENSLTVTVEFFAAEPHSTDEVHPSLTV